MCQEEELKLTDLQRKRLNEESLLSHIENNDEEYFKIQNFIEERVYSALSNRALLLKLAVTSVIQSLKNDPELHISFLQNAFSSEYNNISSNPNYSNNCDTHDYERMLENNVAKLFPMLAQNLIDEIVSKSDFKSSQSSLL